MGSSIVERFGVNLMRKLTIPISLWTHLTSVGGGISVIALTFVASGFSPNGVSVFPMYGTSLH